jgi:predicted enzyme related to lactoylglutathione lyase
MPRSVLAVVAAVLIAGGAAESQQPPQNARTLRPDQVGAFVWHDLVTTNPSGARLFYGSLFGWTFEEGDGIAPGYTIIRHEGQPIGGLVPRPAGEAGSNTTAQWITYVAVADVDKAATTVVRAGGRIFRGPLNARKDLRVAVVMDPQGAALGLASRGPALTEESPPPLHRWLWMEYVARDPEAALNFYGDVVGFTHLIHQTRETFTYYLLSTDRPRAGLFRSLWDRDTSAWLPYVRVADPAAAAERAVALGGRVVLPPAPTARNGSLAIVLDPAGAPMAFQKYPFDGGTP